MLNVLAQQMPATPEEIGQLIKTARKELKLTQKELGLKIGVSESAVNKYENNGRNMTLETLLKVTEALNVDLEIFFKKR